MRALSPLRSVFLRGSFIHLSPSPAAPSTVTTAWVAFPGHCVIQGDPLLEGEKSESDGGKGAAVKKS